MRVINSTLLSYIIVVSSFIVFQLAYSIGKLESYQHDKSHAISAIEKQITSELDKLPIPNHKLQIMGKLSEVESYIFSLNQSLEQTGFPVSVLAINPGTKPEENDDVVIKSIFGQGQQVWLTLSDKPIPASEFLSLFPVLATLAVYLLCFQYQQLSLANKEQPELDEDEIISWLQIDLKQKKLINMNNQNEVEVANKPLCFFSALIDYCQQNPDVQINPNKELPEELISLSNKYFFRLIDLGHTIRKRPNFTNNLEKTLSEIRAALDEIFEKDFDKKEIFYPPKAIGEGSRSKAHSFALSKLDMERLEFIGK